MEAYKLETARFNVAVERRHTYMESMMSVEQGIYTEQQVQIHNSIKLKTQDKQKKHNKNNKKKHMRQEETKARLKAMQNKIQTKQQK